MENILDGIIDFLREESRTNPYAEISEESLRKLSSCTKLASAVAGRPAQVRPAAQVPPEVPACRPACPEVAPPAERSGTHVEEKPAQSLFSSVYSTGEYVQIAKKAPTLEVLGGCASKCTACRLHEGRTNVVFGEGGKNAELMFIGEGPGADEDAQGRPFVGRAGQLLTKMIEAMQFGRQDVYIANIVKCRPPGNRNPADDEAEKCLPYLIRQIELVGPKVVVLLGAVPSKVLLKCAGISAVRGKWHSFMGIRVMPTYHPAYLLRNPPAKAIVWKDLQSVMEVFGKKHGGRNA